MARGAEIVEPTQEAQAAYIKLIRDTAIDMSQFQRECTPGYFNNEGETQLNEMGEEKFRSALGELYGPGFYAFEKLLQDWRDQGDLAGLVLEPPGHAGTPRPSATREAANAPVTQPA